MVSGVEWVLRNAYSLMRVNPLRTRHFETREGGTICYAFTLHPTLHTIRSISSSPSFSLLRTAQDAARESSRTGVGKAPTPLIVTDAARAPDPPAAQVIRVRSKEGQLRFNVEATDDASKIIDEVRRGTSIACERSLTCIR